jgi:hypothetical protein
MQVQDMWPDPPDQPPQGERGTQIGKWANLADERQSNVGNAQLTYPPAKPAILRTCHGDLKVSRVKSLGQVPDVQRRARDRWLADQ